MSLSCHLEASSTIESGSTTATHSHWLVCPIRSLVQVPKDKNENDKYSFVSLDGLLSCPIHSAATTLVSAETDNDNVGNHHHHPKEWQNHHHDQQQQQQGCSCVGNAPTSLRSLSQEEEHHNDDSTTTTMTTAKCRCLACPASEESSNHSSPPSFAWECDRVVAEGCFGWDCQGRCRKERSSSLTMSLNDGQKWKENKNEHHIEDEDFVVMPNDGLGGVSPMDFYYYYPHPLNVPSLAPAMHPIWSDNKTVLAAQSASLLWMLGFLAVTQNATDIYMSPSSSSSTESSILWQ